MARLGELGVLIGGGLGDVDEAVARRLLAEGAAVVLASSDADRGQALVAELGPRCHFVTLAGDDAHGWAQAVADASEHVALRGFVSVATTAGWVHAGTTVACQATAPVLGSNGGGAIAIAITEAHTDESAINALRDFVRSAAPELGQAGIRINAIDAVIDSSESLLIDDGTVRKVTVGDVGAMVAFLLSHDSATCTGGVFVVDGGAGLPTL